MHLGQFIKNEMEKRGMTQTHAGKMMNKTGAAVGKDLEKQSLTQEVIKAWSKLLGINIFRMLADEYEGIPYKNREDGHPDSFEDSPRPENSLPKEPKPYQAGKKSKQSESIETVSVSFQITPDKKEALLKLLTS